MPKQADPLARIPRPKFIEQRLAEIREEAAKLEILLRTAREIEAAGQQAEAKAK